MTDDATDDAIDAPRAAVGFARLLRSAGLPVPTGSTLVFAEALGFVGWSRAGDVYWVARATLCRRPEDVDRFSACFVAWFAGLGAASEEAAGAIAATIAFDAPSEPGPDREDETPRGSSSVVSVRFSRAETLRHRDFATYSRAEHAEARRILADVRVLGATRNSRRFVKTQRRRRPDVRRTVRTAMRTEGEPFQRAFRTRSPRPRRLVLLCDVSGSMEPYSRVIVRFLHRAVVGRAHVEAFTLGTRLTRITRDLAIRDPDAAIAAAASQVADWSGGTRLGPALRAFNDMWGMRGMARGAVVVVISDGWDRGEPEVLAEQMQRLARVTHRMIWVNPLMASPGFAPLAAGMAAALPYVDDFIDGHSLQSLTDLVAVIGRSRRAARSPRATREAIA